MIQRVVLALLTFWVAAPAQADRAVSGADSLAAPSPTGVEGFHRQARDVVNRVLANPEFARNEATADSWWRRIGLWLGDKLDGLGNWFRGLPGFVFWLLLVCLVLCLAAVLAHLIFIIARVFGNASGHRSTNREARDPLGLTGERDLDFSAVAAAARRLAERGEWSAAIRHFYVAVILLFDRFGLIAFRPAKTNGDYLTELAAQPARQEEFRRLTRAFESAVYGGRVPDEVSFRGLAESAENLLREIPAARTR